MRKFLVENLRTNEVNINAAFRVGKHTPGSEPRTIVAELPTVRDKIACLKMSSRLKDTNLYLNEDVSRATQEIRKNKLPLLKQKRQEGFIAYFSGTEIITKRRQNHSNPATPPAATPPVTPQTNSQANSMNSSSSSNSAPKQSYAALAKGGHSQPLRETRSTTGTQKNEGVRARGGKI